MSDDDFSQYPKSVGEIKAEREFDGSLWTPRDALIDMLRAIDSGKIAPTELCCVYRFKDADGDNAVRFVNAGKGPRLLIVGMLEHAKMTLLVERVDT